MTKILKIVGIALLTLICCLSFIFGMIFVLKQHDKHQIEIKERQKTEEIAKKEKEQADAIYQQEHAEEITTSNIISLKKEEINTELNRIDEKRKIDFFYFCCECIIEWILLIGIYFLPSILAYKITKQKNAFSIFIINLFLGWTFVGWVIALAWAYLK